MALVLLVVVLVVVWAALLSVSKKQRAPVGGWPFYAKKLLSGPEQVLYFRLIEALPEHVILAQVQLSRMLGVKKGHNFRSWFNRVNRMSADFVICRKDSSVVAVVELDDASHARADRKIADAKKDKALAAAGIRLIRWQVRAIPDINVIRKELINGDRPRFFLGLD